MPQTCRILVRALRHATFAVIGGAATLGLTACGQPGQLYLPTEPAAANRATLPQSMWPVMPEKNKPAASTSPASNPASVPASHPASAPTAPQ